MDLGYAAEGFDENGVRVSISGSLWKQKKTLFGNIVWKRRWVTCDGVAATVWNLPTNDERGALPKYKYKLEFCDIDTDMIGGAGRKNMFCLTDTVTNASVCLATDTAELLETWIDFLTSDKEYDELLREVEFRKRQEEEQRRAMEKMNETDSEEGEGGSTMAEEEEEEEDDWEDADGAASAEAAKQARIISSKRKSKKQLIKAAVAEKSIGDKIVDYFREHDISSSVVHPVIRTDALWGLMRALDKNINKDVLQVAINDTHSSTCLTLPDFLEWYGHYLSNTGRSLEQAFVPVDTHVEVTVTAAQRREALAVDPLLLSAKEYGQMQKFNFKVFSDNSSDGADLLLSGILDSELRVPADKAVSMKALVDTVVPTIHRLVLLDSEHSVTFEEDENAVVSFEWNDLYQQMSDEASNVYVHANNFTEDEESQAANMERCHTNITASLNYAAFQADFLNTAVAGARVIIDEYALPEMFKSIHSIDKRTRKKRQENEKAPRVRYQQEDHWNVEHEDPGEFDPHSASDSEDENSPQKTKGYDDDDHNEQNQTTDHSELFGELGIDDDFISEKSSMHYSQGTKSTLRGVRGKRATHSDMRKFQVGATEMGYEEMFSHQGLLYRIVAHGVEEEKDLQPTAARIHSMVAGDTMLHKEAGNEHRGLLFMKKATDAAYADQLDAFVHTHESDISAHVHTVVRARTVLETIVDYAGFRVCVTCPVDVNEDQTLVHGFSGVMTSNAENMSVASKYPDESRLFVNAHPPLRHLLPRLAQHLNAQLVQRDCLVASYLLDSPEMRTHPEARSRLTVETLSKKLEVHKTKESGQIYLLNCANLLLPDLPRSDTNDLETRRMRPEFQRNYAQALSPDAYADADYPDFDTQSDSVSTTSGIAKPVLTQNMEKVIKASRHLYTKILPELARVLDTMVTMPLDSTELTNIFHSYGVGMRHIGAVYTLAKSIYIRQLLLVEAVARSCKVLLNNTLRLNARKGKAQTIGAEARQRSTREDFFEHMDMLHEKRKAVVLDLFNLVLGSSKASTQLWSTVLADIVFQKFALTLPTATPNVSKYQSLHVPQLFLAMQYHTGAQFTDHCRYDLDASAEDCVLRHEDLLNYNLPKVKPLSAAPNRVMSAGFVGTLDSLAAPYLASGLYEKASFLYRLRMSLQVTNNQHYASSCDTVNTAHTAYKLALSMYRAGKFRDAANAVMTHLKHGIMYSAIGGRMYLLLMCCHCRDTSSKTHLDKAMVAFDAAKAMFAYMLGSNHPMQAVIMCALADQYLFLGHLQHAIAVMTAAVIFTQRQLEDHGHVLTAAYQFKLAHKVLLNNTLRLNARKGKAQTIGAEARQRSTREDFFEHMDMLHEKRKAVVLDLFNLVLGSSKASTQLWSTVLADIVFQKFALTLPTATPNVSKYQSLHVPQLFLAMQYHTGAQFTDHCRYDLDASAEDCVLRHEDLLNYNLPKVKPLSAAPNRVMSAGFVGTLDSLAAPYLASGLYEKASFLYRLRMSLQVTNNQHYASSCDTVNTAHTAYKLALSMYRAGKFRDAANAVMTHLKHGIMYSAIGGRMYLLLMCCHCRDTSSKTHLDKAMVAFDAAKAMFAYMLGSNHPMQAVIMCALADQYLFLGHLQHAIAVMTAAVIFTQRQLEDHGHVLTAAYQFKLAHLHMRMDMDVTVPVPSNGHKISAVEYLSEALSTYDRLDADGAAVTTEIIDCLYGLTQMCMLVGRTQEALDHAIRCRAVSLAKYGQKVTHKGKHASYMPNQELVLLPAASVACLVLLGDLLMSSQRSDQAVDVFMLVWNAVRRAPSHYSCIGHIYTMLTCKILGALYGRLPFPTRCLLETIAKEVEARVHPQHGIDIPGAWAKAQETVFEAMWINQPKTYFTSVIDGVMRGEIDGNLVAEAEDFAIAGGAAASSAPNENLEAAEEQGGSGGEGGSGNTNRLNLFALQTAVIVRLVQRKERTHKDISYNVTPNNEAAFA